MPTRQELLKDLVKQIANEPWQRQYRKKAVGPVVMGWSERLFNYGLISSDNPALADHLDWLKKLETDVKVYDPAKPSTVTNGLTAGGKILKWGGVERGNVKKLNVKLGDVVKSAKKGMQVNGAPMNSGWTKVAAVFSNFDPNSPAQVIWDSRVSLALCDRLGKAAARHNVSRNGLEVLFPALGWVPGRGGNRPQLIARATRYFRNRYGRWDAHFAGGIVVEEIAAILNDQRIIPYSGFSEEQLKKFSLEQRRSLQLWTPWLVGCVLFMDGQ